MALEPIQLDTLTWDQMVSAIRTRIAAESKTKWTLHAPVDPGVTLLEIFAWLLEQRIYWMDQVPASLVQAIVALLGNSAEPANDVGKSAPAKAAVTLLQFSPGSGGPASFPTASAGTPMKLRNSNPPLIFTLDNDLTLLPIASQVAVKVNGTDHTNDLRQGRFVPLFSPGESSADITITLPFTHGAKLPPITANQCFSLMFELETSADVPAQWMAEAVAKIPVPATLTWSYRSTTNGGVVVLPATRVDDGTAGLRRSGVVRLPLPSDWQSEPAGADASIASYAVTLQIQNASYTAAPRLVRILPNVVLAHHRLPQTKNPPNAKNWLKLPGNVISLASIPNSVGVKEYPPLEDTVEVKITEPDGKTYDWLRVSDASFSGPGDRVFIVDRARSQVRFGDGLTGRLPLMLGKDDSDIQVTYQAGGGTAGNVGQGLHWETLPVASDPVAPFTVTNVVPGDGGKESETLAAARQRAEAALKARNRAVSKTDYETLARTTPGVGFSRAYAAVGHHPGFPCATVPGAVTVFVVPYAPRFEIEGDIAEDLFVAAPQPDSGALQAVRVRLCAGRLIGSDLFVSGPVYRSVWLEMNIASDAAVSSNLRRQILIELQRFLDPLVGGDDRQGWPFGDPLRPSALLRVAQHGLGPGGDVVSVSVRLKGMDTAESCRDVPIRSYELVKLEDVDIRTQRRAVPLGGLR